MLSDEQLISFRALREHIAGKVKAAHLYKQQVWIGYWRIEALLEEGNLLQREVERLKEEILTLKTPSE